MSRLARIALACIVAMSAVAQSKYDQSTPDIEQEHTAWVVSVIRSAQSIKVGMTRSDLMKVFTTKGGLSTTSQRTYVYRQCPLIKVDVKFAASGRDQELPTDKIVEV
jgi:hypothetical protein